MNDSKLARLASMHWADAYQDKNVVDGRVSIPDLNATIGWALGLPIEEKFTAQSGQEFQIAANEKPLTSLFS